MAWSRANLPHPFPPVNHHQMVDALYDFISRNRISLGQAMDTLLAGKKLQMSKQVRRAGQPGEDGAAEVPGWQPRRRQLPASKQRLGAGARVLHRPYASTLVRLRKEQWRGLTGLSLVLRGAHQGVTTCSDVDEECAVDW